MKKRPFFVEWKNENNSFELLYQHNQIFLSDNTAAVNLIGSLHGNIIYSFQNSMNTYIGNPLALVILKRSQKIIPRCKTVIGVCYTWYFGLFYTFEFNNNI